MVEWLEWNGGVNKGSNQRCGRKKGKLYVSVIVCLTFRVAALVFQCLVFTRIVLLKALLLQVTTNIRHPPPTSKRCEQFV